MNINFFTIMGVLTLSNKDKGEMKLKRFLEIWGFELNESNFRYENGYESIDYGLVKSAEEKGELKELSFELSEMRKPRLKDMD